MALTPEQEAKLLQIIAAFDNGKRLNELPHIGSVNPLDLIVEVMDTDGETKQSRIAALLPYLEEQCAYGIEWDTAVSTSACTRIGNTSLHKALPLQNRMKGCLLDDNGKVAEYLSPKNWRAHRLDGTNGQVMVELPAHYRKFETDGTVRRCKLSELPLPGYHFVPKMYISAYEAAMERSTGKLCSVVNAGTDYRGGNNQSEWDGTYRSLLNCPVTYKSRTAFRTAARLRNASATAEWNHLVYNVHKSMFWLYYAEYANRNSQLAFNAQKDANGFAQGGLGNGVTTVLSTDWSAYNGGYPFIPCGCTDDLGNASGEVAYALPGEFTGTVRTVYVNRYRGIENPFGHIWKWVDGINIQVASDNDGGTSKVYVCDDPSKFSDSNYTGYTMRGLEARTNGSIKELLLGEFGDIMPATVGGSSTTYWADYHYTGIPASDVSLRGMTLYTYANSAAAGGLSCVSSTAVPSSVNAGFGSRLCFIPNN